MSDIGGIRAALGMLLTKGYLKAVRESKIRDMSKLKVVTKLYDILQPSAVNTEGKLYAIKVKNSHGRLVLVRTAKPLNRRNDEMEALMNGVDRQTYATTLKKSQNALTKNTTRERNELQKRIQSLRNEIRGLKSQQQEDSTEQRTVAFTRNRAVADAENKQHQINELRAQLQAMESAKHQLDLKVLTLDSNKSILQQNKNRTQKQVDERTKELESLRASHLQAMAHVHKTANARVAAKDLEMSKLQKELDKLRTKSNALSVPSSSSSKNQEELAQLKNQLNLHTTQSEQLTGVLREIKKLTNTEGNTTYQATISAVEQFKLLEEEFKTLKKSIQQARKEAIALAPHKFEATTVDFINELLGHYTSLYHTIGNIEKKATNLGFNTKKLLKHVENTFNSRKAILHSYGYNKDNPDEIVQNLLLKYHSLEEPLNMYEPSKRLFTNLQIQKANNLNNLQTAYDTGKQFREIWKLDPNFTVKNIHQGSKYPDEILNRRVKVKNLPNYFTTRFDEYGATTPDLGPLTAAVKALKETKTSINKSTRYNYGVRQQFVERKKSLFEQLNRIRTDLETARVKHMDQKAIYYQNILKGIQSGSIPEKVKELHAELRDKWHKSVYQIAQQVTNPKDKEELNEIVHQLRLSDTKNSLINVKFDEDFWTKADIQSAADWDNLIAVIKQYFDAIRFTLVHRGTIPNKYSHMHGGSSNEPFRNQVMQAQELKRNQAQEPKRNQAQEPNNQPNRNQAQVPKRNQAQQLRELVKASVYIERWINHTGNKPSYMLLIGPSGSGKTTFADYLKLKMNTKENSVKYKYFNEAYGIQSDSLTAYANMLEEREYRAYTPLNEDSSRAQKIMQYGENRTLVDMAGMESGVSLFTYFFISNTLEQDRHVFRGTLMIINTLVNIIKHKHLEGKKDPYQFAELIFRKSKEGKEKGSDDLKGSDLFDLDNEIFLRQTKHKHKPLTTHVKNVVDFLKKIADQLENHHKEALKKLKNKPIDGLDYKRREDHGSDFRMVFPDNPDKPSEPDFHKIRISFDAQKMILHGMMRVVESAYIMHTIQTTYNDIWARQTEAKVGTAVYNLKDKWSQNERTIKWVTHMDKEVCKLNHNAGGKQLGGYLQGREGSYEVSDGGRQAAVGTLSAVLNNAQSAVQIFCNTDGRILKERPIPKPYHFKNKSNYSFVNEVTDNNKTSPITLTVCLNFHDKNKKQASERAMDQLNAMNTLTKSVNEPENNQTAQTAQEAANKQTAQEHEHRDTNLYQRVRGIPLGGRAKKKKVGR